MPPGLALPDHVELLDLEAAPMQTEEVTDIEAPKKAKKAPKKEEAEAKKGSSKEGKEGSC